MTAPAEQVNRPPSWRTATNETEAAQRQLAQAQRSMEKAATELRQLRAWGDRVACLEVGKRLTEGEDGGALNLLVAAAESDSSAFSPVARAILDRLLLALQLTPIGSRGEVLVLTSEQVSEFEVRGGAVLGRAAYKVMRPGWVVQSDIVARPMLEPVRESGDE